MRIGACGYCKGLSVGGGRGYEEAVEGCGAPNVVYGWWSLCKIWWYTVKKRERKHERYYGGGAVVLLPMLGMGLFVREIMEKRGVLFSFPVFSLSTNKFVVKSTLVMKYYLGSSWKIVKFKIIFGPVW